MENKLNYYFNFDMFASSPNFYFKNHDRINTCFGTLLTLVYIIVSLTLFIYHSVITIQRKNFKVYDSTIYGQEMPFIDLNSNILYFAFGLEDPQTMNRFIDDSIYVPKIVFVDKAKINDELVTVYQQNLEIEKCNVINFGENYQHLFLEDELNNSYCLKKFEQNLTLAGGYKYERFSYIRIRIYPCVNSSENNFSCKSQEEIDHFMSSGYFSIILKDIGLNPSNYSIPVLPTLQDLYTTIDKRIYKNYILNLGVTEIQTDIGLFQESIKTQKYLQFRKEMETFTFRNEEEYYQGKSVIIAQLKLDDKINVQTRSYIKIPEIFSTIGGYMQLMNTAFLLLTLIVNKFNLELNIINSIFKFNLKKKKLIMKLQKLNDFEDLYISNIQTPIVNFKKMTNISQHLDLTDNKNKNNLMKENEINHISLLNLPENKKDFDKNNNNNNKSKIKILKKNKRNSKNILTIENSKVEHTKEKLSKKNLRFTQEQLKENGTNFNKKNIYNELSYKDFNDKLELNMFDYCCCHLVYEKRHKIIELFNITNLFLRKKLDVVNVFNLLLLIEKNLLRNTNEFVYSMNEELENTFNPKN